MKKIIRLAFEVEVNATDALLVAVANEAREAAKSVFINSGLTTEIFAHPAFVEKTKLPWRHGLTAHGNGRSFDVGADGFGR